MTTQPMVKTIRELVKLRLAEDNSQRLLMPPIQRSLVWTNEQIINYWDSLLRGYPAGMMMYHHVMDDILEGRNIEGRTSKAGKRDLQIFDGQQRLAAIMLGFAKGELAKNRKLWVDLGSTPKTASGLKFQLRITSTGQPFGYNPDAPNQKVELSKRQEKWKKWFPTNPADVFRTANGSDIIDAECAIPFSELCNKLEEEDNSISMWLQEKGISDDTINKFVVALQGALDRAVILQEVDRKLVSDQEEYIRFFTRIGQGGTRLSDDELTYSMIKCHHPEIHDRMINIAQSKTGRLASEVDLALASLRVARTMKRWHDAKEWEVTPRPRPSSIADLRNRPEVQNEFFHLVGIGLQSSNIDTKLEIALASLREALTNDKGIEDNKDLPPILLARLPRELVDTLILFTVTRGVDKPWGTSDRDIMRAFVLYWMLFIRDEGKAARYIFEQVAFHQWSFTTEAIRKLIQTYEREGIGYFLPRPAMLPSLRHEVEKADHHLRSPADRFIVSNRDNEREFSEVLRVLSTKTELIKRALMWLQRDYLMKNFPHYDPTSERDEDLPIDLDHIIPQKAFGFHWGECTAYLAKDAISDNFRWNRRLIGDSLGNCRWLSASENRSKGAGPNVATNDAIDKIPNDLMSDYDKWNNLIPEQRKNQPWTLSDVATFQRLIDLRTLAIYEKILTESGIELLLSNHVPAPMP
ncbi:DUF262 domain-containing protein [Beijerinckia mobilis]|uniref:DUF262 domain-containing protein n=1 Tax=Beijerinckia mobilis TaxID=231434 RepID=UPI0005533B45|nr:DUF262 domain-containing protein [Beijerinckia mobilis]